jgi:hypothetical protein
LIESLSTANVSTVEEMQAVAEELATELGRVLETKIRVNRVKERLENLQ